MKLIGIFFSLYLAGCIGHVDGLFETKFIGAFDKKIQSGFLFADIHPISLERVSELSYIGVDTIFNDSIFEVVVTKRFSCSSGFFSDNCTAQNLNGTDSLYLLLEEDQQYTILPTIVFDSMTKINDFEYRVPTILIQ